MPATSKTLLGALGGVILVLVVLWVVAVPSTTRENGTSNSTPTAAEQPASEPPGNGAASAKGVIQLSQPTAGQTIAALLQVAGFVYGNNGVLHIELSQKETGVVVASKDAVIRGAADRIDFAESLLVALPAVPQAGILTVTYVDQSGKGLDDAVSIEVAFPSDLGSGL